MSCRQGSRPSLRTQTYLQCICRAACAVRLSPLRATDVFLLGGWGVGGGRIAGGREKGGGGSLRTGEGGSMWNCPLQSSAKWLSCMENAGRLQGNGTTSSFSANKNSSGLWPSSALVCVSVTSEIPTPRQSSRSNPNSAGERLHSL